MSWRALTASLTTPFSVLVERRLLHDPVEQQHALGEHQLDVDAGPDLDRRVVQPGADRVAPRLDLEASRRPRCRAGPSRPSGDGSSATSRIRTGSRRLAARGRSARPRRRAGRAPRGTRVAVTSKYSPTVAFAGWRPRLTTGVTSKTGMRPTMLPTLANPPRVHANAERTHVSTRLRAGSLDRSKHSGLAFSRASDPTIHRPPRPARAAALRWATWPPTSAWSWHPETQDVFAALDAEVWRRSGHDPVKTLGAVSTARLRGAGRGQALRAAARARARRPRAVPHRRPLVPEEGRRRRASGDRLLLAGVRHHLGAAAVLRRPRHPRRRPPQDGQRPRRAAHRRRAALPARLLPPGALARGLAAGDLPGARPRRAADHAAARGRRHPGPGAPRDARATPSSSRASSSRRSAGCRCCCSTPTSRTTRCRCAR